MLAACGPATPLLQDLGLKVPRLTLQQHSGHCPLWSWTPALSTGGALGPLGRTCFCTPFSGWTHRQPVLPRAGVAPLSTLLSGWPLPICPPDRSRAPRRRPAEGPGRSQGPRLALTLQPALGWEARGPSAGSGHHTWCGRPWDARSHSWLGFRPPTQLDPAGRGSGWLELEACACLGSEIVKATSLSICLSPPTFSRMSRGPEHRAAVLHGGSLGIAAARSPGLADLVRGASVIRSLISEHFGCPPGRTRQVSVSRGTEQHGVGLSQLRTRFVGVRMNMWNVSTVSYFLATSKWENFCRGAG